jgi:hypothetical protein
VDFSESQTGENGMVNGRDIAVTNHSHTPKQAIARSGSYPSAVSDGPIFTRVFRIAMQTAVQVMHISSKTMPHSHDGQHTHQDHPRLPSDAARSDVLLADLINKLPSTPTQSKFTLLSPSEPGAGRGRGGSRTPSTFLSQDSFFT